MQAMILLFTTKCGEGRRHPVTCTKRRVMGDERTYERAVAAACRNSTDAMTADWKLSSYEFMAKVSK